MKIRSASDCHPVEGKTVGCRDLENGHDKMSLETQKEGTSSDLLHDEMGKKKGSKGGKGGMMMPGRMKY